MAFSAILVMGATTFFTPGIRFSPPVAMVGMTLLTTFVMGLKMDPKLKTATLLFYTSRDFPPVRTAGRTRVHGV